MKLGMSSSCFKDYSETALTDLYKKTGAFAFLEIWDDDGYFVETTKAVKEWGRVFADAGIGVCSVHTPFTNWSDSAEESYFDRLKASLEKARILKAGYVVAHPVAYQGEAPKPGLAIVQAMPKSAALWRRVAEIAATYDLNVAFENLGRSKQWAQGCSMDSVVGLVAGLNMENVGICLDFSHCFALGHDVIGVLEKYGEEGILGIHASDGIYAHLADQHLLPGQGELNWTGAFTVLKKQGFQGHINLEVKGLPEAPKAVKEVFGLVKEAYDGFDFPMD